MKCCNNQCIPVKEVESFVEALSVLYQDVVQDLLENGRIRQKTNQKIQDFIFLNPELYKMQILRNLARLCDDDTIDAEAEKIRNLRIYKKALEETYQGVCNLNVYVSSK